MLHKSRNQNDPDNGPMKQCAAVQACTASFLATKRVEALNVDAGNCVRPGVRQDKNHTCSSQADALPS